MTDTWTYKREYELLHADGKVSAVSLAISPPRRGLTNPDWTVEYLICGIGGDRVRVAYGVDGLEALLLALQAARLHLAILPPGARLLWRGEPGPSLEIPAE